MRTLRFIRVKGTAHGGTTREQWSQNLYPALVIPKPSPDHSSLSVTDESHSGTELKTDLALPVCPSSGVPGKEVWWGVSGPSEARRTDRNVPRPCNSEADLALEIKADVLEFPK